jgi:hypothetical protein
MFFPVLAYGCERIALPALLSCVPSVLMGKSIAHEMLTYFRLTFIRHRLDILDTLRPAPYERLFQPGNGGGFVTFRR